MIHPSPRSRDEKQRLLHAAEMAHRHALLALQWQEGLWPLREHYKTDGAFERARNEHEAAGLSVLRQARRFKRLITHLKATARTCG
jgi:hypothetical protein